MYEMSKCNSERKVERSGGGPSLMAKDMKRKAKGSSDESMIKKEKRNIRKRSEYVLKQISVQRSVWLRARNGGRSVEHNVHDTWLTGAMVARTCGAHQGAGETSAGFEANGDLMAANSMRDEGEDGRRG